MVYYYLFAVSVNYYFEVTFKLKLHVILYAAKITQNTVNMTELL